MRRALCFGCGFGVIDLLLCDGCSVSVLDGLILVSCLYFVVILLICCLVDVLVCRGVGEFLMVVLCLC